MICAKYSKLNSTVLLLDCMFFKGQSCVFTGAAWYKDYKQVGFESQPYRILFVCLQQVTSLRLGFLI